MLEQIELKVGSSPAGPPLAFHTETMTILVGPNNSGKTMALQEIEATAKSGGFSQFGQQIIKTVRLTPLTSEDLSALCTALKITGPVSQRTDGTYITAV